MKSRFFTLLLLTNLLFSQITVTSSADSIRPLDINTVSWTASAVNRIDILLVESGTVIDTLAEGIDANKPNHQFVFSPRHTSLGNPAIRVANSSNHTSFSDMAFKHKAHKNYYEFSGSVNENYNNIANWRYNSVTSSVIPGINDTIYYPNGLANSLRFNVDTTISAIFAEKNTTTNQYTATLTVTGYFYSKGNVSTVEGAETVKVSGFLAGTFDFNFNVDLSSDVKLIGNFTKTGPFSIAAASSSLDLNGHKAKFNSLNLNAGGIILQYPSDTLEILGNANFDGNPGKMQFSSGNIRVGANLNVGNAAGKLNASSNAKIEMIGTGHSLIDYADPVNNKLRELRVNKSSLSDTVTLNSNLDIAGGLLRVSRSNLHINGNHVHSYNFEVTGPQSRLIMKNSLDTLLVANAIFNGADHTGLLREGAIKVSGDFNIYENHSTAAFVSGSNHKVIFGGSALQKLVFNPASSTSVLINTLLFNCDTVTIDYNAPFKTIRQIKGKLDFRSTANTTVTDTLILNDKHYFNRLIFPNANPYFTDNIVATRITFNGALSWTLNRDLSFNELEFNGNDTLDLNGHNLTVKELRLSGNSHLKMLNGSPVLTLADLIIDGTSTLSHGTIVINRSLAANTGPSRSFKPQNKVIFKYKDHNNLLINMPGSGPGTFGDFIKHLELDFGGTNSSFSPVTAGDSIYIGTLIKKPNGRFNSIGQSNEVTFIITDSIDVKKVNFRKSRLLFDSPNELKFDSVVFSQIPSTGDLITINKDASYTFDFNYLVFSEKPSSGRYINASSGGSGIINILGLYADQFNSNIQLSSVTVNPAFLHQLKWTGNFDSNWNNAQNWEAGAKPISSLDSIYISRGSFPVFSGVDSISYLQLSNNRFLRLQSSSILFVKDRIEMLDVNSNIHGSNASVYLGAASHNSFINGRFGRIALVGIGNISLTSNLQIDSVFTHLANPSTVLNLSGYRLDAHALNLADRIVMNNVNDRINVQNTFTYSHVNQVTSLTNGIIELAGNVIINGTGFQSSGSNHTQRLIGSSNQLINFNSPGNNAYFNNLEINKNGGRVFLQSDIFINGNFRSSNSNHMRGVLGQRRINLLGNVNIEQFVFDSLTAKFDHANINRFEHIQFRNIHRDSNQIEIISGGFKAEFRNISFDTTARNNGKYVKAINDGAGSIDLDVYVPFDANYNSGLETSGSVNVKFITPRKIFPHEPLNGALFGTSNFIKIAIARNPGQLPSTFTDSLRDKIKVFDDEGKFYRIANANYDSDDNGNSIYNISLRDQIRHSRYVFVRLDSGLTDTSNVQLGELAYNFVTSERQGYTNNFSQKEVFDTNLSMNLQDIKAFESVINDHRAFNFIFYFENNSLKLLVQKLNDGGNRTTVVSNSDILNSVSSNIKINKVIKIKDTNDPEMIFLIEYINAGRQAIQVVHLNNYQFTKSFELGSGLKSIRSLHFDKDNSPELFALDTVNNRAVVFTAFNNNTNTYTKHNLLDLPSYDQSIHLNFAFVGDGSVKLVLATHNTSGIDSIKLFKISDLNNVELIDAREVNNSGLTEMIDLQYRLTNASQSRSDNNNGNFFFIGKNKTNFYEYKNNNFQLGGSFNHINLKKVDYYFLNEGHKTNAIFYEQDSIKFLKYNTDSTFIIEGFKFSGFSSYVNFEGSRSILNFDVQNNKYKLFVQNYFVGDKILIGPTQSYKKLEDAASDPRFKPGVQIHYAADPAKPLTIVRLDSVLINIPSYISASDSVIFRPLRNNSFIFRVSEQSNYGAIKNITVIDTINADNNTAILFENTHNNFYLENLKIDSIHTGIRSVNSRVHARGLLSRNNQIGIDANAGRDQHASVQLEKSLFINTAMSVVQGNQINHIEIDSIEVYDSAFTSNQSFPLISNQAGNATNRDFRINIKNSFFHDLNKTVISIKDTSLKNDMELDVVASRFVNINPGSESREVISAENSKTALINNVFKRLTDNVLKYIHKNNKDTSYIINNVFDNYRTGGAVLTSDLQSDSTLQIFNNIFVNGDSPRLISTGTGKYLYGYLIMDSGFLKSQFDTWGIHHNPDPFNNIFSNVPRSNFDSSYRLKANSLGLDIGLMHPELRDRDGSRTNIGSFAGIFNNLGLTEQVNARLDAKKDTVMIQGFTNPENRSNLGKYYIVSGDSVEAYWTAGALTLVDSTNNLIYDLGPKNLSDKYLTVAASHITDGILSRSRMMFRPALTQFLGDSIHLEIENNKEDSIYVKFRNYSDSTKTTNFQLINRPGINLGQNSFRLRSGLDSVKIGIVGKDLPETLRSHLLLIENGQIVDRFLIKVSLKKSGFKFAEKRKFIGLRRGETGSYKTLIRNPFHVNRDLNITVRSILPQNQSNWLEFPDSLKIRNNRDSIVLPYKVYTNKTSTALSQLAAKIYLEDRGKIFDSLAIAVKIGNILELGFTAETKLRVNGNLYQSGFVLNWLTANDTIAYELQIQKKQSNQFISIQNDTVKGKTHAYNNLGSGDYQILLNSIDTNFISNTDSLKFSVFDKTIKVNKGYWQLLSSNTGLNSKTTKEILTSYTGNVYQWSENEYDYVMVNDTALSNGKAYWFKPSVASESTHSENSIAPAAKPVIKLRKGWNQVGNPWNWPILWSSQEVSFDGGANFVKVSEITSIERFHGIHYLTSIDYPALKDLFISDSTFIYEPIRVNKTDFLSYIPNSRGVWVYSESESILRFNNVQIPTQINTDQASTITLALKQNGLDSRFKIELNEKIENESVLYHPPLLNKYLPLERSVNGKTTMSVQTNLHSRQVHEYDFKLKGEVNQNSDFSLRLKDTEDLYIWVYHIQAKKRLRFDGNMSIKFRNVTENDHVKIYLTTDPDFEPKLIPTEFTLLQNYPNPFNPVTNIVFDLPFSDNKYKTKLVIYNILGQKIKTLYNGYLNFGVHEFRWNGYNDFGSRVASGIYFYRIDAGRFQQAKKMILVK